MATYLKKKAAEICKRRDLVLIEDCAHTAGCRWGEKFVGTFGAAGCFSTQTYKHLNSGEGGLLVTNDDDIAARAILFSGSYMLFDRHKKQTPNFSLRMANLAAALLRPQLEDLDSRCKRWNERYDVLASDLGNVAHLRLPARHPDEGFVGSSLQFTLVNEDLKAAAEFVKMCKSRGVDMKWFGAPEPVGFTSTWESWQFLETPQQLPRSRHVLNYLCDFRVPLTFSLDDCRTIAAVIRQAAGEIYG